MIRDGASVVLDDGATIEGLDVRLLCALNMCRHNEHIIIVIASSFHPETKIPSALSRTPSFASSLNHAATRTTRARTKRRCGAEEGCLSLSWLSVWSHGGARNWVGMHQRGRISTASIPRSALSPNYRKQGYEVNIWSLYVSCELLSVTG